MPYFKKSMASQEHSLMCLKSLVRTLLQISWQVPEIVLSLRIILSHLPYGDEAVF